ncbi:hypothetical protein D3C71_2108080 [compost metagenome]
MDRFLHSLDDVAIILASDKMGNNLGVRFRAEMTAFRHQLLLELQIIFDDAVMNDREFMSLIRMRMRVRV